MAFGADKNRLVLASGKLYIGTPGWVTPELIGSGNGVRYNTYFTGDQIGSIKRGTQVIDLKSEYVMAEVETPAKLFREDSIRNHFEIAGSIYEVNTDLLSTIYNREVVAADPITVPAVENWDVTFLGSDIEPINSRGLLLKTRDVSGKAFEVGMYSGISVPEDGTLTMSGDDYVLTAMKFKATPHPNFTTLAEDRKSYGYIARQNS